MWILTLASKVLQESIKLSSFNEIHMELLYLLLERAYDAHLNQFEALIYFSAAVLMSATAGLSRAQTKEVNQLATAFIAVRIMVYLFAYNEQLSVVRSSVFWVGIAIVFNIFDISDGNQFVSK